jgi:hypothetical protein
MLLASSLLVIVGITQAAISSGKPTALWLGLALAATGAVGVIVQLLQKHRNG